MSEPDAPRVEPIATPPAPPAPQVPRISPEAAAAHDPRRLAGTVTAFDGGMLTARTDQGRTYRALVNAETVVACPPREAIEAGRVFTPVPPPEPLIGPGGPVPPPVPRPRDRYGCPADEISAGRRIVGAVLGDAGSGDLQWVAIALAPR